MLLPLQGVIPPSNFPKAMPWAMCSLPLRGAVGQMRILKFLPYGQWVCDKSRAFRVQIILCDSASLRFKKRGRQKKRIELQRKTFCNIYAILSF